MNSVPFACPGVGRRDDPFAERLRPSEDVLRIDRLVRRDEHEPLDAALRRDLGQALRREHVVAHGLDRVRLDQRDVLVGRAVEHDGRAELVEDLPHRGGVRNVRENGNGRVELPADELPVDVDERRLGVVHEDHARGRDRDDLPADLAADRAAGAGDEHRLAGEVRRDRGEVELHRLAAEQVLDLDRADLPGEIHAVVGDELVHARERLHDHVRLAAQGHDALVRLAARGRDRDDDLVGTGLPEQARQVIGRPRARGCRSGACSACAGCRPRGRSACSRACGSSASR